MKKYRTCMLIDDEAELLEALKLGMDGLFERVDTCADGAQALNKIGLHQYDLVISDIQMPTMRGDDLLKAVRAKGIKTPFIYMSGNGSRKIINDIVGLGAVEYIEKPFDFESFFTKVCEVMDSIQKNQVQ